MELHQQQRCTRRRFVRPEPAPAPRCISPGLCCPVQGSWEVSFRSRRAPQDTTIESLFHHTDQQGDTFVPKSEWHGVFLSASQARCHGLGWPKKRLIPSNPSDLCAGLTRGGRIQSGVGWWNACESKPGPSGVTSVSGTEHGFLPISTLRQGSFRSAEPCYTPVV